MRRPPSPPRASTRAAVRANGEAQIDLIDRVRLEGEGVRTRCVDRMTEQWSLPGCAIDGEDFRTGSDTAVLVHSTPAHDADVVEELEPLDRLPEPLVSD